MKRSTGGLVLLERTSVKDGNLFLRLLVQSSRCRFSSSNIASGAARCRQQGTLVVDGKQRAWVENSNKQHYYVNNHVFKSTLSCSARNPYLVLTDGATVCRNKVVLMMKKPLSDSLTLSRQAIYHFKLSSH